MNESAQNLNVEKLSKIVGFCENISEHVLSKHQNSYVYSKTEQIKNIAFELINEKENQSLTKKVTADMKKIANQVEEMIFNFNCDKSMNSDCIVYHLYPNDDCCAEYITVIIETDKLSYYRWEEYKKEPKEFAKDISLSLLKKLL
jgi:predicted double-glycine peptidase